MCIPKPVANKICRCRGSYHPCAEGGQKPPHTSEGLEVVEMHFWYSWKRNMFVRSLGGFLRYGNDASPSLHLRLHSGCNQKTVPVLCASVLHLGCCISFLFISHHYNCVWKDCEEHMVQGKLSWPWFSKSYSDVCGSAYHLLNNLSFHLFLFHVRVWGEKK